MFYNADAQKAWGDRSSLLLIGFGLCTSLIFLLVTGLVVHRINRRLAESEIQLAEAREALRESDDRFRYLASSAQDAILVVDHRARITFWSAAAGELFGYSAEEAIGREAMRCWRRPESIFRFRRLFSQIHDADETGKTSHTLEMEGRRKNGDLRSFEVSLSTIKWKDQRQTIAIFHDITSRKLDEKELRQAIRQAETANFTKSNFLANISHEIRTPLNVIIGLTELLGGHGKEPTPAECREFMQMIYASGQQLKNFDQRHLGTFEHRNREGGNRTPPLQSVARTRICAFVASGARFGKTHHA